MRESEESKQGVHGFGIRFVIFTAKGGEITACEVS